jgi:xanthine dehydrogenase/oxidase
MSPDIDIGQIEGAFVMGMGYHTTELIVFNYEGKILTNNTWTYHPPGAKDIPCDFRVKFPKNNPNPVGVLKSKGKTSRNNRLLRNSVNQQQLENLPCV